MVFFGGFHHLKGQRYEHTFNYKEIKKHFIGEKNDPYIENIKSQLHKDMIRTHFPQEEKIRKYEKLWGISLKVDGVYSLSKIEAEFEDENNNGKIAKEIKKSLIEIEKLSEMATNILSVYSLVDKDVGYVQGMNSIASCVVYNIWVSKKEFKKIKAKGKKIEAKMTSVFGQAQEEDGFRKIYDPFDDLDFELEFTEEECFFIFYGIMKYSNQRRFFDNELGVLQGTIKDFELYLSHELPEVHKKMCCEYEVKDQ